MIHVVMDKRLIGVANGYCRRLKPQCSFRTGTPVFAPANYEAQLPTSASQQREELWVLCMLVWFRHLTRIIPPGGIRQEGAIELRHAKPPGLIPILTLPLTQV